MRPGRRRTHGAERLSLDRLFFSGSIVALDSEHNTAAFRGVNHRARSLFRRRRSKTYAESRRLDRPVAGLGLRSPPPLQLLNPLLKALHHEREPLVTEPMGVAETR